MVIIIQLYRNPEGGTEETPIKDMPNLAFKWLIET
jgi:hypothetical protein